jgi:hypothetical protein
VSVTFIRSSGRYACNLVRIAADTAASTEEVRGFANASRTTRSTSHTPSPTVLAAESAGAVAPGSALASR